MNNYKNEAKQLWEDDDDEAEIYQYLYQHLNHFIPTAEERSFIDGELELENGKVKIQGWLLYTLVVNIIGVIFSLILIVASLFGYVSYTVGGMVLTLVSFVFIYAVIKRKRYGILLFKIIQAFSIIMSILSLVTSPNIRGGSGIGVSIIWLIYAFVSKRLKFTLVEK